MLDKHKQVSLKDYRVCEVESGVCVDVGLPETNGVNEPVELLVPVHVLGCAQGMSNSLDTIDNRTGKIVGRINLSKEENLYICV